MYKEFGLTFESCQDGWYAKANDALKNGILILFLPLPIFHRFGMDRTSDLAKMSVVQFLKMTIPRADVFIVDESIKSVADLKGKKNCLRPGLAQQHVTACHSWSRRSTEQDVQILPMGDPFAAKNCIYTGNADATVSVVAWWWKNAWNQECKSSDKYRFTSNIIMDGFIARKDVLERKRPFYLAFPGHGSLPIQNEWPGKNGRSRHNLQNSIEVPDDVSIILDGMKKIHFCTYGDNINFFGLSTDYTGITDSSSTQKWHGYIKRLWKQINQYCTLGWSLLPGIIQAINDLQGEVHAAEGQIQFDSPTAADAKVPAVAIKPIIINFATVHGHLLLKWRKKSKIQLGQLSVEFAGW